ncbi:hypothetical protein COEREDRAFT_88040 [Coemansia reversa NRRL 1564]|uniref:SCP domain-containing protein n=1 Tax=Coemansia reversa (strain ATCC 12441 / NRRL 1564) TaxID=763665 RepID=A0A2G5B858_COERN|nr:hypothetical protein COEREDRAFT_88040 [Coemansia reversa NRRL 1564]|eukprot:PIA15181.1 hypothetical protein COEREDRAFT_88040 [Coemansia reversa NRRL 1564]
MFVKIIQPLSLLILLVLAIFPHTLLAEQFDKQRVRPLRRDHSSVDGYLNYWQNLLDANYNPVPTGLTKTPEHRQTLTVVVTETVIAYVYVAPPGENDGLGNLPSGPTENYKPSNSDSDTTDTPSDYNDSTDCTNSTSNVEPTNDTDLAINTDQTDNPNYTSDTSLTSNMDLPDNTDQADDADQTTLPKPTDSVHQSNDWKTDMLNKVNEIRAAAKKPPLKLDDRMNSMAQAHSDYQESISKTTHEDPAGGIGKRCSIYGVKWSGVAENVLWGSNDVTAAVKKWRNSGGHYANMIGNYEIVGFGVNKLYWTQTFAKE